MVIDPEARALGIDVALQPFVNIDRDLEFGRGYNTFGEDPYLTGQIGAAEIKREFRRNMSWPRSSTLRGLRRLWPCGSTVVDDQTLHEVYVAPFDAAIKAGVSSIMCSYNRINDTFACGNPDTPDENSARSDRFQGLCHI